MTSRTNGPDAGRRSGGFTLIELMIVVAVVAILAAIAYPAYQEHVRKTRRAQAKADLVEYTQLAERHHTVRNTYEDFAVPDQSPREGTPFYRVEISDVEQDDYRITATPVGPQAEDRCGTLAITAAGVKSHSLGSESDCQFGSLVQSP